MLECASSFVVVGSINQSNSVVFTGLHGSPQVDYTCGCHWLPLVTIYLEGDNREFEV